MNLVSFIMRLSCVVIPFLPSVLEVQSSIPGLIISYNISATQSLGYRGKNLSRVCAISRFLPFTAINRDFSKFPQKTAFF